MQTKRKKIAILIWNMDIGGVQKRVRDIIHNLTAKHPEYEVHLIVKKAYPTSLLNEVKKEPINIHYFSKSKNKIYLPSIFWLIKTFNKINPDVLLTFLDRLSVQAVILKRVFFWKKFLLVLNEGVFTSKYLEINENKIWAVLIKLCYPFADKIIVPTLAIKNDLSNNFNINSRKIHIIKNWILGRTTSYLKSKKYDFIFVGRIEKEKNVFALLDLIKSLKTNFENITLCILGKGSLEKTLIKKINDAGLKRNVFFYGFKDNIVPYLTKSKIMLLPSLNEGMPNCVLEAARHQIPSIINNFKGANEVLSNRKTGYIYSNQREFFNFSQDLLTNESLRCKMGKHAYESTISVFGEKNLNKFVKILLS